MHASFSRFLIRGAAGPAPLCFPTAMDWNLDSVEITLFSPTLFLSGCFVTVTGNKAQSHVETLGKQRAWWGGRVLLKRPWLRGGAHMTSWSGMKKEEPWCCGHREPPGLSSESRCLLVQGKAL